MGNGPHRMKGENVDYFSVKEENCLIMRWLLRFFVVFCSTILLIRLGNLDKNY